MGLRPSVLVVEDYPPLRMVILEVLRVLGGEIHLVGAVSTEDAPAVLRARRPQLVILGLGPRQLQGGLCCLPKGEWHTLVLTPEPSIGAQAAMDVLPKPFDIQELADRVRQALRLIRDEPPDGSTSGLASRA